MTTDRDTTTELTAPGTDTTRAGHRRRRGSGHELREVVIREATDLLAAVGDVNALTMRAVATAAGVTPPSVYRHFPDKEALIAAVITQRFTEFTAMLRAAADTGGDQPRARLQAMARGYVRAGLAEPGHYRVLFSATHAGSVGLGLAPDVEHPGVAAHRMLIDAVAACLPADHRSAAVSLATELWASLHGIVDLRITKPEMPWPNPDLLLNLALTAVLAAAADRQSAPMEPS